MHSHVNFVDKSVLWQGWPVDNFWMPGSMTLATKKPGTDPPAFPVSKLRLPQLSALSSDAASSPAVSDAASSDASSSDAASSDAAASAGAAASASAASLAR